MLKRMGRRYNGSNHKWSMDRKPANQEWGGGGCPLHSVHTGVGDTREGGLRLKGLYPRIPLPGVGRRHSWWRSASLGSLYIHHQGKNSSHQCYFHFHMYDELRECLLFSPAVHPGFDVKYVIPIKKNISNDKRRSFCVYCTQYTLGALFNSSDL